MLKAEAMMKNDIFYNAKIILFKPTILMLYSMFKELWYILGIFKNIY